MKYFFSVLFLAFFISAFSQTLTTSFIAKAKYSNKQVVWYEYDYWLDGSKLSDTKNKNKFNDILFKKVGNKYYKAQTDGAFNVEDWGVKKDYEGGKSEENSRLIQAMIDYFPIGYTASIYIPAGNYQFNKTIVLNTRPLHMFGDNGTIWGNSTKLIFPANTTGIVIDRGGQSIQETILEKICLIGGGGSGAAARSGIYSNARIKIRNVTVKNFGEHGFTIKADIGSGGEASGSSFEYCHAVENGQDGFFAGRTDGNAITFIGCDARDNGGKGFNDDSFLGNNFISCMAHYNKGGDFYVRDKGNARSLFQGCYSEGGNKTSELSGQVNRYRGYLGHGIFQRWRKDHSLLNLKCFILLLEFSQAQQYIFQISLCVFKFS
jgi:hypothetical protein